MSNFEFNSTSLELSLLNALRLAEASELAYKPSADVEKFIKTEWRLDRYHWFENSEQGTQAFLTGNKDVVILVFRGTESIRDWITDSKIKLIPSPTNIGKVHFGFNKALEVIWDELSATINDWNVANKLWVSGHSLGGALATLAVDRLTENSVPIQGMYTFGQPMVGDKDFKDNFDSKMRGRSFRFVDDEDIVPKIITTLMGYRHIEKEYFFDNAGKFYTDNLWWHKFVSRSIGVSIRTENTSTGRAENPGGISDHSPAYYIRHIRDNLNKNQPAKTFKDWLKNI